jgi:hypothetical protein
MSRTATKSKARAEVIPPRKQQAVAIRPVTYQVPAESTSPVSQTLAMIMQAAQNPRISVDKLERLLAVQKDIMALEARRLYDVAMMEMQPKLPTIEKNGMITIRDKVNPDRIIQQTPFAKWEDIHKVITPILHDHGFILGFRSKVETVQEARLNKIILTLAHRAGHREESELILPVDASGSKNNVQGVGSSLSYAKRYTTTNMLNLRFAGEDDDGQAGGGTPEPENISADQIKKIQKALGNQPMTRVLTYVANVTKAPCATPQEIPAAMFENVMAQIKKAANAKA